MLTVQNSVSPSEMPAAMAILTSSQTFGGAVALSIAQAIFTLGLRTNIPKYAPAVNLEAIIEAGATGFQSIVPPSELIAYCKSINRAYYFVASPSVVQFAFSWVSGGNRSRLRKRTEVKLSIRIVDEEGNSSGTVLHSTCPTLIRIYFQRLYALSGRVDAVRLALALFLLITLCHCL